jgi:hypothetical protein
VKFLMQVGDQLDLNVSYDGGAVDGVAYNAPDGYDNKVSVTSAGIVTALGLGEGVVNVLSGGAIVGSIVFEVLTEAAYVAQQGIRDGSKALIVDADAVAAGIVKISPTLTEFYEVGPAGYVFFAGGFGPGFTRGAGVSGSTSIDGRYDFLWDGLLDTYWYASSANGAFGYFATAATTIKEVRIWANHQNLTARPTQIVLYGSNVEPTSYAGGTGTPPFAFGNDSGWTQIAAENLTWGGSVSEQKIIDVSANATQYKHYKVKAVCGEAFVALGGVEFWGLS